MASTTPNGQVPARNPYVLESTQPQAKARTNCRPRRSSAYISIMNVTAAAPNAVSMSAVLQSASGLDRAGRWADLDGRDNGGMSREARLGVVLGINMVMVLALLVVGLFAHSLGVLASGADYLGDAFGAGLALLALRLSRRGQGGRASSVTALVNASLLLAVTLAVIAEAIYRLSTGAPSIHGVPVVVVSVIAAGAMIACAFILGDVGGDLGMESVMLDTVADAAAALGVAVSGGVILLTGGTYWLDSLVALVIALVVAFHAIKLLRKVVLDLRQRPTSPSPVGVSER